MPYNFGDQYERGLQGEADLDGHFQHWYTILTAPYGVQRMGIDRVFVAEDGDVLTVEYKVDELVWRTGNAFVETVSVDTDNTPGWALSSKARFLVYYDRNGGTAYGMPMASVREWLPQWQAMYREVAVDNGRYRTRGVLVPVNEFRRIATRIFHISDTTVKA